MTKEEAFKNLVALNAVCGQKDFFDKEFEEALLVAEKALEQQPCPYWDYGSNTCRHANIGALATKPYGDAISREEILDILKAEWVLDKPIEEWSVYRDVADLTPVTPKDDVLDKIRAEIEKVMSEAQEDCRDTQDDIDCGICAGIQRAIDIIDKYKDKGVEE